MSYKEYWKDQLPCILVNALSAAACSVFLSSVNIGKGIIGILLLIWFLILICYINVRYYFRNRYFRKIQSQLDHLDQKFLISEVMDRPEHVNDRFYYSLLKAANKSMIEQVSASKRERKEYKEYIEQWIHDVKTPIAAMQLICENNKSDTTRKLLIELEKINHFTQQALYYARSENVEKDYLIKETVLSGMIHQAVSENKQLLLQNHIGVQIENCECSVYTDEKWIGFILNQLIANAVKYRTEEPILKFKANPEQSKVILSVCDNGIGIPDSDLPRVFDKGFTGQNGRTDKGSTGIGLYLCKRLSDKLGIGISIESNPEQGTAVKLSFPKGDFVEVQN
ncbi:MAG: HAMP domain-containing histidine kinase [Ruminococcaceae bacterium]|nr:HAMP domain-containing histidine kinase [Oscillospiraceae bacterium]